MPDNRDDKTDLMQDLPDEQLEGLQRQLADEEEEESV